MFWTLSELLYDLDRRAAYGLKPLAIYWYLIIFEPVSVSSEYRQVHITHWVRTIHSVHQAWRLWRWIVENDEWKSKRSLQDKLNRSWDGRSQGKLKLKNRFDRTKHNAVCVEADRKKATRNAVSIAVELESGEKDKHRKLSTEPPSQTPEFDSCLQLSILA